MIRSVVFNSNMGCFNPVTPLIITQFLKSSYKWKKMKNRSERGDEPLQCWVPLEDHCSGFTLVLFPLPRLHCKPRNGASVFPPEESSHPHSGGVSSFSFSSTGPLWLWIRSNLPNCAKPGQLALPPAQPSPGGAGGSFGDR